MGCHQWRQEAGARPYAQAENGMFRYEWSIGGARQASKPDAQKREAMTRASVVNTRTAPGMPASVAVGA